MCSCNAIGIIIILLEESEKKQETVRDDNGNIIFVCELENGVRHGKCYHYYPNGNIRMTYKWVKGVIDGKCFEYFENGCIKVNSYFVNGLLIKEEFYDKDGRVRQVDSYIIINRQSKLNGKIVYDVENSSNYPYNVNFQETTHAEIFADSDTVNYGSFVEYGVMWMCSEDYYVGGIKSNSTFHFDHNFEQYGASTFASKRLDLDNKNKFYPSNFGTDTLRVIFSFAERVDGDLLVIFEAYLEKVFTVIEK